MDCNAIVLKESTLNNLSGYPVVRYGFPSLQKRFVGLMIQASRFKTDDGRKKHKPD